MNIFEIKDLKIELSHDKKFKIFSGHFRERLFFGTNEKGRFEITNIRDFYDFEIEYIINEIQKYHEKK